MRICVTSKAEERRELGSFILSQRYTWRAIELVSIMAMMGRRSELEA